MPDYCMCKGDGCTQRDQCFRFRAKPNKHRQSYFMDVPGSGDECHHFMPVDGWPERMLTELDLTELAEPKLPCRAGELEPGRSI